MKTNIAYGIHSCTSLLTNTPELVKVVYVAEKREGDNRLSEALSLATTLGLTIQICSNNTLNKITSGNLHQGIAVLRKNTNTTGVNEKALKGFIESLSEPPLLLILDQVTDPHNLGACLRSADAAGVHAVITPKNHSVGLTPVVSKVACGAAEVLPFFQVTNLVRTIKLLKSLEIWVVGTCGSSTKGLYETDMSGPLALVLGSEGKGVRQKVMESCDFTVNIPMAGSVESLNVSVAAGVCLFEIVRQRRNQNH